VLCIRNLMRFVIVVHGRVVVLVVVGRGHVLPATSVTLVVDNVSVLVRVHKRAVVMLRQRPHLLGNWSLKVNWLVPPRESLHRVHGLASTLWRPPAGVHAPLGNNSGVDKRHSSFSSLSEVMSHVARIVSSSGQ
jgi:hypothetical protein